MSNGATHREETPMQATTHHRHVELGQPGTWIAALVIAVSLALAVAGGLALTNNLPWQGDAASADTALVAGGSSAATVNDRWAHMRFEEENSWGADFVLPALPQVRAHYYPSMGEGFTGNALAPLQPALRARYYPSMGEGFTCGCLVDITSRTPLVPPYNDGPGTDY
jgi:hypothetical protein